MGTNPRTPIRRVDTCPTLTLLARFATHACVAVSLDTEQIPLAYSVAIHTPASRPTQVVVANFAPTNDSLRAFLRLKPERR